MSTRTIEPDATNDLGSWTVTGAGAAHTALSDDTDASYVTPPLSTTSVLELRMADPGAAPLNNRIVSVTPRLRGSTPSSTPANLGVALRSGGVDTSIATTGQLPVSPGNITVSPPFTFKPAGGEWDETALFGLSVKWTLASGNTTARLIDFDVDIEDNEAPTVTVTQPTDDNTTAAGTTVTTTSTPTTAWTYTDPEGDPQERWEVRRYRQPTAGWGAFNPDTTTEVPVETRTGVGTGTSTVMSTVLENGATYRDYVRAADTTPTGFAVRYSPWAFREFTLALTPPPNPTIAVTPQVAQNRVKIDLTAGTGTPTTEEFKVERSDDGGTTWTEIRLSPVTNTGGTVTVYDYEAPRSADGTDQPIVYRVRAIDTTTGNDVYSAAVQSSSTTLGSDGNTWLKSTSDPTLNITLDVTPAGDPLSIDSESEEPQAVYYAQGRFYPTVHSADIRAERWTGLQVKFDDDAEREAFEELRFLQEPLLWQTCNGDDGLEQHYIRLGGVRTWRRVVDATQNQVQAAIYLVAATEVEMP